MIPILFRPGTTSFTTNGEGRLTNCRRCEVTEVRNGQYECLFEYPKTGPLFGKITQGSIIFATHDNGGVPQPFVVYSRSAPLEGFVTFRASHISYQLSNVIVAPFTASSCAAAIASIKMNSITTNPFTFWTNKSVNGSFAVNIPKSARAILGGSSGSLLDTFGKGEYEFDVYTVKLYTNRGADRGVSIRYGKNLAKLNQEISSANSYNAVVPYWVGADETVSLDHVVYSGHPLPGVEEYSELATDAGDNIQTDASDDILVGVGYKTVALDLSEYFDEAPTQAQLEAKAISLMEKNEPYEIKENIKLDFVQMWQTEEYKNYENLQKVYLCDTVHIFYEPLGIIATAKCIKTVYDTLKERYISIELGEPRTTLTETVQSMINTSTQALPSKDMMAAAIDHATELISGGFGGYIKYHYLSDGTPSEMLIMDSPDEATATNIIRLNQNGIGFSTDGGHTYASAWTIDGAFNADFITTGTLIANLIRTGLLQDETGDNYWNLDTGEFVTTKGEIGGWTITANGLVGGNGAGSSFLLPASISVAANNPNLPTTRTLLGFAFSGMDGYVFYPDHPSDYHDFIHIQPRRSGNDYSNYKHYVGIRSGGPGLDNVIIYPNADTSFSSHTEINGGLKTDTLKIGSTGLSEAQLQGLLAYGADHIFTGLALSNTNPLTIKVGNGTGYWGGIICGLVQNVGSVVIGIIGVNGTIIVRDLMNNTAWSHAELTFSASGDDLTISSNQSDESNISLFIG